MDWFLYDTDPLHERVKQDLCTIYAKSDVSISKPDILKVSVSIRERS